MNSDQRSREPDATQPTQPARPAPLDRTQPARPVRPEATRRPAHRQPPPPRRRRPRRYPARYSRSSRRGCLAPLLALALLLFVGGLVLYGLLMVPGPTNILILGIDRRPGEGDATRTDTLLLLHVDPRHRRLVMLSIPRDLWVTIPGRGEARINAAHVYGELEAPGSGPARAAQTITYNFGLPVDHVLRLDFDAFRQVIDAAGGVEVNVPTRIVDDAYPTDDYGTVRIEIPPGPQHMDGTTALQYARSRHGNSDFDRAARQQQLLVALTKKMASPGGWLFIPRVYRAWQTAVDTDLGLRDLARLAWTWQRVGEEGVERIVIDRTLTTPFRTAEGAAVLLPRWELIRPLVQAQLTP